MLPNANLLQIIKQAAVEAVEASKPCAVMYGKVKSLDPLAIVLDQKLTLSRTFLTVTQSAKDNLAAGDTAVLLRMQGGQQYLVLDKAVNI